MPSSLAGKALAEPWKIPQYLESLLKTYRDQAFAYYWNRRAFKKMEQREIADFVLNLKTKTGSEAHGPKFAELLSLYDVVVERQPQTIFEFGSGWSTYIFAKALADVEQRYGGDRPAKVFAFESDRQWFEHTQNVLPDYLSPYCEVIHSPIEESPSKQPTLLNYTNIPDEAPDMVYIDGPVLEDKAYVTINPVLLESRFQDPFVLIIDSRFASVEYYTDAFEKSYRIWEDTDPLDYAIYCHTYFELV
jgi:hypothetical protein